MANRETMETVTDFVFLGSQIMADSNCSHKIKRCLLLGRKAMTNLESILKSRDITLMTKVCLVKAMVFPVQFSSVAQSCLTLCDFTNHSTPGLPVHHQLLEFTPSNHLILCRPLSPPTFNLLQHQGLFKWVSSLHHVAKVLEFQLQHQSFQWIFRADFL